MRSDGAAPGPVAPLCGALSLVLGALLGKVIEGRGVTDAVQRFSSRPPYLPASFRVLGAEAAFFLRETRQDPAANASLRARVESFFAPRARGPLRFKASYGPFSVEKVVPLDSTLTSSALGSTDKSRSGWRLKAHVLRDQVSPGRPSVQVLFHLVGRDWAAGGTERLPCLRLFAFAEAREARAGCRLRGPLALCVAELRLPPGWFAAPSVAAPRRRPAGPAARGPVELYYAVHPADGRGDCAGGDGRTDNAIRPGKDGPEGPAPYLRRIGALGLSGAQDGGAQLRELRLDDHVAVWLPSRPAKQGDVVTASVTLAGNSTLDLFTLRAKVKKGLSILSARTSEPGLWAVRQELGAGAKHSTTAVVCQRLGPGARNRSSSGSRREVAQLSFRVAAGSGLSGAQPVSWQVEYPGHGAAGVAVAEILVSQRDLVGIVPVATDTELLNTAVLTGKVVALPLRVVSVEQDGTVTEISEAVECQSADEDVLKVSDRCDHVFVNGKEVKGKVDAVVNFTYQHLSAPLHLTVWAPRLPLQIEVSDTELSQIKGWRVPLEARTRPTRDSEDEDEEERRGRGCALQYQRATLRVLTQFAAQGAGPWSQPRLLLGPHWQVDVTHLVAASLQLDAPHVAALQDGGVLVGREAGMTTLQVLSPLSDSILAEKTVTVLEDRVSLTGLAVQLVAGLSVSLRPSAENGEVVTAVAMAQELLGAPKQEAVVSTWLQFSDGSISPLDAYDDRDFALTATSLDEAVLSVPQARAAPWPVVVAEGEGQGPLLRLELGIAETCQKAKRRGILAVGMAGVRVKFGQHTADSGPVGADQEHEEGEEGEIKNQASDRRPKGPEPERAAPDGHPLGGSSPSWEREEGASRRGSATARSLPDNRVAKNSWLDGGRPPAEGQLQNIPLDLSNFPGQAEAPRAGAGLGDGGLVPTARGLSDLETGMYALLGVFCLAILVFLVNCATFALKYRRKQPPPGGQASGTHSHDWVWLGTEAELLASTGEGSPPPAEEHTTVLDRGPGAEDSGRLLLHPGGDSRQQGQGQGQAAEPGAGPRPGGDQRREALPSPGSRRKKVKFAAFTAIPPDDGCPIVNSILGHGHGHGKDTPWLCQDPDRGARQELRNYLEKFKDKV